LLKEETVWPQGALGHVKEGLEGAVMESDSKKQSAGVLARKRELIYWWSWGRG